MSRKIAGSIGLLTLLFSFNLWAQTAQDVAQCRAENQRAHSELVQLFQNARSAGNISPKEVQAFKAMEARLHNIAQKFRSDGLTLAECQRLSGVIATERANVERMAATPAPRGNNPQLAQCRADNQREHSELLQQFRDARAAGNISPKEAQAFKAMEARLHNIAQKFRNDGLTLAECQRLSGLIANERANVQRMATPR